MKEKRWFRIQVAEGEREGEKQMGSRMGEDLIVIVYTVSFYS